MTTSSAVRPLGAAGTGAIDDRDPLVRLSVLLDPARWARWARWPTVTTDQQRRADPTVDDAGAWRNHTTGEFAVEVFPGGHFYVSRWWAEIGAATSARLVPATTPYPAD